MARPVGNTTGEIQLLWNPYQVAFLNALDQKTATGKWAFSRLTLFAGRRGGKTRIGGVACQKLSKRPGTVGWVCAPTYPDLHDFVLPSVFSSLPEARIKDWSAQYLTLDQLLHLVCTCPNKDFARAICAVLEIAKKAQNLQFLEAEITGHCYLVPRILANGSLVMVASLLNEVVWKNGEEVVYDKLDLRLGSLEYECFVHQFVSEPYTREATENE